MAVHYEGKVAKDIDLVGTEAELLRHQELRDHRRAAPSPRRRCSTGQPVLVIGSELAEKLLAGRRSRSARTVQIGGLPYRIIGVVEKQGTLFGLSLDKFAVMPFSAPARRLDLPDQHPRRAHRPDRRSDHDAARHGRGRGDHAQPPRTSSRGKENNFAFQTAEGALGTWQKISKILFLALPGLVAISLVVGGIVIMNIMLMAVSERTREIGIRKALGARRRDILAQFVVESATLSAAGALLGHRVRAGARVRGEGAHAAAGRGGAVVGGGRRGPRRRRRASWPGSTPPAAPPGSIPSSP